MCSTHSRIRVLCRQREPGSTRLGPPIGRLDPSKPSPHRDSRSSSHNPSPGLVSFLWSDMSVESYGWDSWATLGDWVSCNHLRVGSPPFPSSTLNPPVLLTDHTLFTHCTGCLGPLDSLPQPTLALQAKLPPVSSPTPLPPPLPSTLAP